MSVRFLRELEAIAAISMPARIFLASLKFLSLIFLLKKFGIVNYELKPCYLAYMKLPISQICVPDALSYLLCTVDGSLQPRAWAFASGRVTTCHLTAVWVTLSILKPQFSYL